VKISVIGTGYVGLTTGTGLADFGWDVTCVDIDKERTRNLQQGIIPIYERGLKELVEKNVKEKRLSFTTDVKRAIEETDVIFIAVGTPPNHDGSADLSQVWKVANEIGDFINKYKVIVIKSTISIGTTRKVYDMIKNKTKGKYKFDVVFNPEFLREGSAVQDFFHPDRVVIGVESEEAKEIMKDIYRPLYLLQTPFIFTNIETAEMIKYAANSFLAMKITFINEVANFCEKVDADVHDVAKDVAKALGMDGRISQKFLHPGPGYGGSCFPKDTQSFAYIAKQYDSPLSLIEATIEANEKQKLLMVNKIERLVGGDLESKMVAILGLAFKQRDSPAIAIINKLLEDVARVKVYDPQAINNAKKIFGNRIEYCRDEYEAARDADILVIVTDWNQFRGLDLERIKNLMRKPAIADLRNVLDAKKVKEKGFIYEGVGRK